MPDVVTFNPATRQIVEIPAGSPQDPTLDNETNIDEIYSEWKVWYKQDGGGGESPELPNARYSEAMRTIGGDPVTETQNAGATFFLLNGWRLKPAEGNHRWTIVGNIFTDPAGESIFDFTDGAFTVNTENRVSNLVDSSVSRLDLTQLLPAVFVDDVLGVPGTATGVGTPTLPSDNIADAFTIANRDNLREFRMRGDYVLDRIATNWVFRGLGSERSTSLDLAGFDVDGAFFEEMRITGSHVGEIEATRCALDAFTSVAGIFRDCGLLSDMALQSGGDAVFANCFSEVAGTTAIKLDYNTATSVQFRNYSGGLEITDMTAGGLASIDLDPGHLLIGPTNTGGDLLIRGIGRLTKFGSPEPAVTIVDNGFVNAEEIYIGHQTMAGNADISGNNQLITIYDNESPMNVIRTLSVDAAGKIRRILT